MPTHITSELSIGKDEQGVRAREASLESKEKLEALLVNNGSESKSRVYIESQASRAHGKLLVVMRWHFDTRRQKIMSHSLDYSYLTGGDRWNGAQSQGTREKRH